MVNQVYYRNKLPNANLSKFAKFFVYILIHSVFIWVFEINIFSVCHILLFGKTELLFVPFGLIF